MHTGPLRVEPRRASCAACHDRRVPLLQRRPARCRPRAWAVLLPTALYAVTCTVGASVRTGLLDTSRARWVHHALFVATASATGLAALRLAASCRVPAALALATTAVPFAALTRVSTRTDRHALVALTAAPAYAAALALTARRPA